MASCKVLSFCNYMKWYLNKEVDYYLFTDMFVSIQLACHTLEYPPPPPAPLSGNPRQSGILDSRLWIWIPCQWNLDSGLWSAWPGRGIQSQGFWIQSKKSPGSERNPDVLACFIRMYTLANGTRLSPLEVKTKVYCENMKPFKQKLLQ